MSEFKRENRYFVLKRKDIALLSDSDQTLLSEIAFRTETARLSRLMFPNQHPLQCVVIESDWPEYEPVWRAIESRMTGAINNPTYYVGHPDGTFTVADPQPI